jgi:hypothetical protein
LLSDDDRGLHEDVQSEAMGVEKVQLSQLAIVFLSLGGSGWIEMVLRKEQLQLQGFIFT